MHGPLEWLTLLTYVASLAPLITMAAIYLLAPQCPTCGKKLHRLTAEELWTPVTSEATKFFREHKLYHCSRCGSWWEDRQKELGTSSTMLFPLEPEQLARWLTGGEKLRQTSKAGRAFAEWREAHQ